MKTNAIIRIIIWSLVLVLLIGILSSALLFRNRRLAHETPAATEVPVPLTEPVIPDFEDFPVTCDTKATVTADALNVRSAPSTYSPAVGMVEKGDVVSINRGVQVGENLQEWLGIYAPVEGWISAKYVDSLEGVVFYSSEDLRTGTGSSSGTSATASAIVTVYSAPSIASSSVGQIDPGDAVVIGRQENVEGETWAYITEPTAGWVMTKNLEIGGPVSEALSPADPTDSGILSLDPRQIREIDIEWAAGEITIEPADVDGIQISESEPSNPKYAMVWKQNNDKLTIRFCENTKIEFGFGITLNDVISKDLTILVPMGWECESLEVDAASATLEVKNLVIDEVDFDGASGICKFENCTIKELDLDTASGDIFFTGSLDVLDCDAASASVIAVFDNAPSRISMDSMSGDLDITLHQGVGFTVSMDALSSDFHCAFGYSQKQDGTYYRGDGKCRITLDALSGDLYIREYKTADAVPETTAATEVPAASESSGTHHHTEACTTDPDSCPDNSTHHADPHHN